MRGLGSVFLAFLLALNVVVQGIATIVVAGGLAVRQYDVDTVAELRTWRLNIAHDVTHYNVLSKESMAERVCNGDAGLETSASQSEMYDTLDQYLGPSDAHLLGPLMCILGECNDCNAL